jgi:hypothetical protein
VRRGLSALPNGASRHPRPGTSWDSRAGLEVPGKRQKRRQVVQVLGSRIVLLSRLRSARESLLACLEHFGLGPFWDVPFRARGIREGLPMHGRITEEQTGHHGRHSRTVIGDASGSVLNVAADRDDWRTASKRVLGVLAGGVFLLSIPPF